MADDLLLQFIRYGENSDGHCGCDSCPEHSIDLMEVLKENTALKQLFIYIHICRRYVQVVLRLPPRQQLVESPRHPPHKTTLKLHR